jgi:hypothetical protein
VRVPAYPAVQRTASVSRLLTPRSNVVWANAPSPQHATRTFCCVGDKRCALATRLRVFDSLSESQLERLYAGLVRLASMDETVLAALVEYVLAEGEETVGRRWRDNEKRASLTTRLAGRFLRTKA